MTVNEKKVEAEMLQQAQKYFQWTGMALLIAVSLVFLLKLLLE